MQTRYEYRVVLKYNLYFVLFKASDGEDDLRPSSHISVTFEKSLEEVLEAEKLDRVLVFTTVKLLGLLTVAKKGSVDGTYRSCTILWKQMFIVMVEVRGVFIPIAFAFLPDKTTASYYVCLFLILSAFCEHSEEIHQLYGQSSLALRKIKCDFEIGIHLGWQMFRISGCYFHYTQVGITTKLL